MPATLDYDQLAADYSRHRAVHPGVLAALVAAVPAGGRVLEVGCGTANYLAAVQAATGCAAFGLEPSAAMLARAAEKQAPLDLRQGRAETLPYDDGTFDLVCSVDVIHHVGDRDAYFAEARRVLRPGGRVVTVTDSAEDIARRVPLSSHFPETVDHELRRYPAIPTLRAEMAAAGLAGIGETTTELDYDLTDSTPYRDRAFSSLHLVDEDAWRRGLARLDADLAAGPLRAVSLYTLVWGANPGPGGDLSR